MTNKPEREQENNKPVQENRSNARLFSLPNSLTMLRIVGSVCLLLVKPRTAAFYVIYTASGLSDVLDGWIARSTGRTTELGAKLDSLADLLFYAVMLLRIFPFLWTRLPAALWRCFACILCVRLLSYLVAALKHGRFASLHTYLNKFTGLIMFFLPYALIGKHLTDYCTAACVVGALASVEELLIHLFVRDYSAAPKTILRLPRK